MVKSRRAFLWRLLLLLVVAVVPASLAVALSPPPAPDLEEIAERTANELDRLIQLRMQQVFTIAAFPSIRAYAASSPETRSQRAAVALNELQSWVSSDTDVREAFLTDAQGIVIMATREGWNSDVSARKFVQEALGGQLAVSPIAKDRGEFSTYYAAPVLNNSKEIAGALVVRVAAQEMWGVTPHGDGYSTILTDENGVRLDDSGMPAFRLTALGSLDVGRATDILNSQLYGAQQPQILSTGLEQAQEIVRRGALDELRPADLNAGRVGARRLVSKPWYVLLVAPQASFGEMMIKYAIPFGAAVLMALGGALLLERI
ncbi:MAG: cache domain-containing protein [Anaerolineae bacterium]|nr:cache domain-containing protein [Anaerolineae bacterium]